MGKLVLLRVATWWIALIAVLCYAAAEKQPKPSITLPCEVVSVHDGDTLTVDVKVRMNVRLLDCWAKELNEPGGTKARDRLRELAAGEDEVIEIPLAGKQSLSDVLTLDRVLGRVWVNGKDVGDVLVKERLATREKRK
jgi:endonuclease YncB( thermonuclease family)